MTFHWQRIAELSKNPFLPHFATNFFSNNGSAVMTMYPYLFLYPFIIVFHYVKSVTVCSFIMYGVNTFLALLVSYWSSRSFNRNRFLSFIFALIYSITPYILINGLGCFYIGELYAFVFMPLVIFGFLHYLRSGKWVMLSIGMTLLIYNSLITATFTPFFLLIWLIFNYRFINKIKIINLIKAIGLTFATSALFLLPAFKLLWLNNMNTPNTQNIASMGANDLIFNPLNNVFDTNVNNLYSIYLPIGIIIGLIVCLVLNKVPHLIKQSYIIAILVIFISSNYFPWFIFNVTPVSSIQYTGRLLVIPKVILSYLISIFVFRIFGHRDLILKMIGLVGVIFSIQLSSGNSIYYATEKYNHPIATNHMVTNPDYQTTRFHHQSAFDYYPKASLKALNKILYNKGFSQHQMIQFHPRENGIFVVNTRHTLRDVNLPFLDYNGIQYRCYIDNHLSRSTSSKQQLVTIPTLKKGSHQIQIKAMHDRVTLMGLIITLVSLIIYIFMLIKKLV